jgi:hypothetical protein
MGAPRNHTQKANHTAGERSGKDLERKERPQGGKEDAAAVPGANQTGNKSQGGKFDSGKQTNR